MWNREELLINEDLKKITKKLGILLSPMGGARLDPRCYSHLGLGWKASIMGWIKSFIYRFIAQVPLELGTIFCFVHDSIQDLLIWKMTSKCSLINDLQQQFPIQINVLCCSKTQTLQIFASWTIVFAMGVSPSLSIGNIFGSMRWKLRLEIALNDEFFKCFYNLLLTGASR